MEIRKSETFSFVQQEIDFFSFRKLPTKIEKVYLKQNRKTFLFCTVIKKYNGERYKKE